MPEPSKSEVLHMQFQLDTKDVIKSMEHFKKAANKYLGAIEKKERDVSTTMGKYITKLGKIKPAFAPALKAMQELEDDIAKIDKQMATADARMRGASEEKVAAIQEEIRGIKERKKEKLDELGKLAKEAKKDIDIEMVTGIDAAREAGKEIAKPLELIAKKDLPGAGKALGGLLKKSGKGFMAMGEMKMDPKAKRGMMGGIARGAGGLAKGLGPIVKVLSKAAPFIGLMSGAVMGLMKIFMDAESAAKGFHKGILETTSTAGYLSRNLGDVSDASEALEADLKVVRDAAMDWSNVQWGISKDTAQAFISSLTAEGVTLRRLREETERATAGIDEMANTIQMSVAYSRAFGVSLNELSQLQGELMTEVGMGLDTVNTSFQMMTRGAEEAGMASNKFFGLVKSFSADLSLFTLRMADLVKVMTVLGKTMSPRNAQQYLQTITQFFKGQGLLDRTRAVMLGGKKEVGGVLKADLGRRVEGMLTDLGPDIAKVLGPEITKGKTGDVVKAMAQFSDKLTGAQREAILDATIMQGKLNSGNLIEIASALKDASPIAVTQILDKISQKRFGKPMSQLVGQQKIAFEAMTGFNDEMIDQNRKAAAGVEQVQMDLAFKIERYQKESVGKSEEQLKELRKQIGITAVEETLMKNLGVTLEKDGAAKEVRDATASKIWHSMDAKQKDLIKGVEDQRNFQKEIADHQVSIAERLGIIADFLLNKLYNIMMGVWHSIGDIFKWLGDKFGKVVGRGVEAERGQRFRMAATRVGDPRMTKALEDSEGDIWKARNLMIESMGKEMIADLEAGNKKVQELSKDLWELPKEEREKRLKELEGTESIAGYVGTTKEELYKMSKEMGPDYLVWYLGEMKKAIAESGFEGAGGKTKATAETKAVAKAAPSPPPDDAPVPKKVAEEVAKEDLKAQASTKDSVDAVGETVAAGAKETIKGVEEVKKAIDKPSSDHKKAVTDSTLEAIRKGLFEYYMYSAFEDRAMVAEGMKSGAFDPTTFGEKVAEGATKKGDVADTTITSLVEAKRVKPAQAGGLVASIVDGKATLSRLPPGEGWTPIGVGERILPAGAGGGGSVKVELALKGDFGRFIQARVIEGTAQFEKNKRLR